MIDPIEKNLKDAILTETPEMLEDLMKELPLKENLQDYSIFRAKKMRKLWIPAFAAAAVLFFAAGMLYAKMQNHAASSPAPESIAELPEESAPENETSTAESSIPSAIICLDVNPAIELTVDENDHVISFRAVNREAEELLSGLDLKGSDIRVASYAVVGAMLTSGYLRENTNSLLVSVVSDDPEKGHLLENDLTQELNLYLENIAVSTAVFGQYAASDPGVENFAKTHRISYGKAWLIRTMMSENDSLTEESLLNISTQELLLLWSDRLHSEFSEDIVSYGTVDTSAYISKEEALLKALSHAGISGDSIQDTDIHFDCEDGTIVYEVEFHSGTTEYEYDIRAIDGTILAFEQEKYTAGQGSHDDLDHNDDNDHDDDDD